MPVLYIVLMMRWVGVWRDRWKML